MYYRIFNEVDEHYYPYAYNETDFDSVKDCVAYMLGEMAGNGDIEEDVFTSSIEQLSRSAENDFPFHPQQTANEIYSLEKSSEAFSLNDLPSHMLDYVGKPWRS